MLIPQWGTHANRAKFRHDITEEQIANVWLFGVANQTRNECWKIVGEEITLILNSAGNFIITMYPNKYNDRHTSKIAKQRKRIGNTRGIQNA